MPKNKEPPISRFTSIEDISTPKTQIKSTRANGVCGAAPTMLEDNPKREKYISQGSAVPVIHLGSEHGEQPPNKPNLPPKDLTRLYNISSASEDDKIEQQVSQILKKPEE